MKKRVWVAALPVLLLCTAALYSLSREPLPSRVTTGFGIPEYQHYQTVEQLEQEADLIISARFTGERETVNLSVDWEGWGDAHPYFVSRSTVKIGKVFKGPAQKGDHILINEEGYLQDDTYHGSVGYKWMTKKGEYLLFLEKSQQGEHYVIIGNYQGKFDYTSPIDPPATPANNLEAFSKDRYEYYGEHFDEFYHLKKQALPKYPILHQTEVTP